MNTLPESDLTILRDLAADSDPEPASDADARVARAAYEAATSEAAALAGFLTNRDTGDEHRDRFTHCSHGCELRRDESGRWRLVRECTLRWPCTVPDKAAIGDGSARARGGAG